MKKSFPVIFPVFFAVLVSNALSYAASSPIPCEKAHELPPISDNDMGFIRGIVSGLKDVLDDVSCPKLYCKKYLAWEQKNYFRLPACSGFYVDPKGKVGPLTDTVAKLVAQDIETYGNKSPFMQNYSQFEAVCKNFDLMNASEKVGFYAWFFENLAFHETTCSPIPENTAANVPNGPAVGLYQLEYDPAVRSWRGPACAVSRAEILTDDGNTRCAFEIFRSQLVNHHDPFGSVNAKGRRTQTAYWQSTNPTRDPKPTKKHPHPPRDPYHEIQHYLGFYPACGNPDSGQ